MVAYRISPPMQVVYADQSPTKPSPAQIVSFEGFPGAEAISLRPGIAVFRLSGNMIQVGSSPEHSVVFRDLEAVDWDWFSQLRKGQIAPFTERQLDFVDVMRNHGLLDELKASFRNLRICVNGLSPLGIDVVNLLVESGLRRLELLDPRPADREVEYAFPPHLMGISRANALRQMISTAHPEVRLGSISEPDLTIVVGGPVVDLGIVGRLLADDYVHLPICVDDRSITIGPLVLPGKTACAVCVEHALMEGPLDWPRKRRALEQIGEPQVPAYLRAGAAGMALQMIEQLATGMPLLPGRHLMSTTQSVSWRVFEQGIETRIWHPHPACTCTIQAA